MSEGWIIVIMFAVTFGISMALYKNDEANKATCTAKGGVWTHTGRAVDLCLQPGIVIDLEGK